jgi:hypothetical protein
MAHFDAQIEVGSSRADNRNVGSHQLVGGQQVDRRCLSLVDFGWTNEMVAVPQISKSLMDDTNRQRRLIDWWWGQLGLPTHTSGCFEGGREGGRTNRGCQWLVLQRFLTR